MPLPPLLPGSKGTSAGVAVVETTGVGPIVGAGVGVPLGAGVGVALGGIGVGVLVGGMGVGVPVGGTGVGMPVGVACPMAISNNGKLTTTVNTIEINRRRMLFLKNDLSISFRFLFKARMHWLKQCK